jgi:hypothetical protein
MRRATVQWKRFLRFRACTCDVMLYSAWAGDVIKQYKCLYLVAGHLPADEWAAWVMMTWYMTQQQKRCRKRCFSEYAWSARRLYQSTDQGSSVSRRWDSGLGMWILGEWKTYECSVCAVKKRIGTSAVLLGETAVNCECRLGQRR